MTCRRACERGRADRRLGHAGHQGSRGRLRGRSPEARRTAVVPDGRRLPPPARVPAGRRSRAGRAGGGSRRHLGGPASARRSHPGDGRRRRRAPRQRRGGRALRRGDRAGRQPRHRDRRHRLAAPPVRRAEGGRLDGGLGKPPPLFWPQGRGRLLLGGRPARRAQPGQPPHSRGGDGGHRKHGGLESGVQAWRAASHRHHCLRQYTSSGRGRARSPPRARPRAGCVPCLGRRRLGNGGVDRVRPLRRGPRSHHARTGRGDLRPGRVRADPAGEAHRCRPAGPATGRGSRRLGLLLLRSPRRSTAAGRSTGTTRTTPTSGRAPPNRPGSGSCSPRG